jgi:hypothetical protein
MIGQALARPADLATATGKEFAVTKKRQDKAAADERNRMVDAWMRNVSDAPLSDLGKHVVLLDKLRRIDLRKMIELSAELSAKEDPKGSASPTPEFLATMAGRLRRRYGGLGCDEVLDFIINALDPATQSGWKLEFKRGPGQPANVNNLYLYARYLCFREAHEVQGAKQAAHKQAVGDLATKRTFGATEAAIRRGQKMMGW